MGLQGPIEVDLDQVKIEGTIDELTELLKLTPQEAKLRLIKDLAEELSKHYNVNLSIKEKGRHEIISKNISIKLVETPNILKWLSFK